MPLFGWPERPGLIFTERRRDKLRHAGEISFPGGRADPGETLVECALREAREEIGLDPGAVEVVGALPLTSTVVTSFKVLPVVGLVPQRLAHTISPHEVERVIDTAVASRIERGEPVVALGGGVVGDLAGLVSALYMRGTPFIQVPTTLLAQIDSSIGGKVAVNHRAGKNLIGAFHQPLAVYADPETLGTLPDRELRAGLYEAVKYGILGDARLFAWIERRLPALLAADVGDLGRIAGPLVRTGAGRATDADRGNGRR